MQTSTLQRQKWPVVHSLSHLARQPHLWHTTTFWGLPTHSCRDQGTTPLLEDGKPCRVDQKILRYWQQCWLSDLAEGHLGGCGERAEGHPARAGKAIRRVTLVESRKRWKKSATWSNVESENWTEHMKAKPKDIRSLQATGPIWSVGTHWGGDTCFGSTF